MAANGNQCPDSEETTFPGFATAALHAGQEPEQWASNSVVPLISLSTTYKQHAPGQLAAVSLVIFFHQTSGCFGKLYVSHVRRFVVYNSDDLTDSHFGWITFWICFSVLCLYLAEKSQQAEKFPYGATTFSFEIKYGKVSAWRHHFFIRYEII